MFKVVFINPPKEDSKGCYFSSEHLGISYLQRQLLDLDGVNQTFIDGAFERLTVPETVEKAIGENPDLLAISCLQYSYQTVKNICSMIKLENDRISICLGGLFISSCPDIASYIPKADYYVMGEGEQAIRYLVANLRDGKNIDETCGVGEIERIQSNRFIIKSFVTPNFNDVGQPMRQQMGFKPDEHYALIQSSRGCQCRCVFCTTHSIDAYKEWRARDPENIVSEIENIKRILNPKKLLFVDDNFFGPGKTGKNRALKLADMIVRKNIRIPFSIACRIVDVDLDLFSSLEKAGLSSVFIGIDSFNNAQLHRYRKGYSSQQILEKYALFEELNVTPVPLFIMFDAYVTIRELEENLHNIMRAKMTIQFSEICNRLIVISGSDVEKEYQRDSLLTYDGPIPKYNFINHEIDDIYSRFCALNELLEMDEIIWSIENCEDLLRNQKRVSNIDKKESRYLFDALWEVRKRYYEEFIIIVKNDFKSNEAFSKHL